MRSKEPARDRDPTHAKQRAVVPEVALHRVAQEEIRARRKLREPQLPGLIAFVHTIAMSGQALYQRAVAKIARTKICREKAARAERRLNERDDGRQRNLDLAHRLPAMAQACDYCLGQVRSVRGWEPRQFAMRFSLSGTPALPCAPERRRTILPLPPPPAIWSDASARYGPRRAPAHSARGRRSRARRRPQ